ncbi:hypothetical protein BJ912DRAFT_932141 [Pholiota molesta]|nr:hypothetical protein BJ912DRAFT_932141 [Pholiota molesta]
MPSPDPLPFEITSSPPVAGPSNPPPRYVPPRASPVSHHTPVMGLGGALISSNRAQAIQRQREADIAATRRVRAAGHRPYRRRPFALSERDDDAYIHMLLNPYMDDEFIPLNYRHLYRGRTSHSAEREQYHQSYTHPPTPEPGFTFDFAMPSPDDENAPRGRFFPPTSKDEPIILGDDDDEDTSKPTAGPSSSSGARETSPEASKIGMLLVCAKCLDPLILNAGLNAEEAQYKRVWALRCGHLIDEKCLNILGQPPLEEEAVPDKKGKGKAKVPAHKNTYGDAVPELQSLAAASEAAAAAAAADVPDIRSRLRSRRPNHANGGDPVMPGAVSAKKPRVEAEFQWACPVASCRRVHVSVKIDGIWGPEKELPGKGGGKASGVRTEPRGAIAVFA